MNIFHQSQVVVIEKWNPHTYLLCFFCFFASHELFVAVLQTGNLFKEEGNVGKGERVQKFYHPITVSIYLELTYVKMLWHRGVNQWTGFFKIGSSFMKKLTHSAKAINLHLSPYNWHA